MKYPINEVFITIQGEGFFSGTPSIFIRLQGCNVGCPWCDTKHTWKLTSSKQHTDSSKIFSKELDNNFWMYIEAQEILTHIQTRYSQIKHVVITGGEPAAYDLYALCLILQQNGKYVQIETSATEVLNVPPKTWVTASPKINMPKAKKILDDSIKRANEIKMPIGSLIDIANLKSLIKLHQIDPNIKHISLQPISQNEYATKLCIQECIENNWHFSIQIHKAINLNHSSIHLK